MRLIARVSISLTLLLTTPTALQAATVESAEAAKVASWLRNAAPADGTWSHFSVLGMPNFNGLGATADTVISTQGPAAFYQNAQATQQAGSSITSALAAAGTLMQDGGITAFRDVQNLPWGMIEPSQGQYNFSLMDLLVQNYQNYRIDYVGVAMPFASWDQVSRSTAAAICQHFFTEDYKYLALVGKMDRYVNLDAFSAMLQTAVERYDGDGVSDMAGLQRAVSYWQLQNEPEGGDCGQFRNDVAAYVEFMRRGYNAVKAACPSCKVLNGGAMSFDKTKTGGSFWYDYASLGGNAYIDIVAMHYNDGKGLGEQDVSKFELLLASGKEAFGATKPIWITEFGVIVNAPAGGSFVSMTEAQAAAWYTRFYVAGLNAGVTRFFSDAISFFTTGQNLTLLLPYYTNKLLETRLESFTASSKLATGQYRFTVNGSPVYVLWSGIPAELTGTVTSFDIYGNATTGAASSLKPSQESPLIVVTGASPDITAPSVPGGLAATARSSSQIDLSWAAATDNVGVKTYRVYRSGILLTAVDNATSYSSAGLSAATPYSYTLAACDAAGNCSAQSAAAAATTLAGAASYALNVTASGTGYGNVTSSPAGISCYMPEPGINYLIAPDCSESYASGTSVTLTATPSSKSTFAGWSGDCTGSGVCTVSMSGAKSVTANFISASDCLFNWAERSYPQYFAPAGASSATYQKYYYRYYAGTGNYLATASDNYIYLLGPVTGGGNVITRLAPVGDYLGSAGCSQ